MEPLERRDAFLNVSKYGCKLFLNMEPLETPVSKYGTTGTGVCKQFPNREPLEPSVSNLRTVGTGGFKQILNRELLEPPVSK